MTEVNNDILKAHIHYYKNESKRYKKEIGKLKRTLKEITDIAKSFCDGCQEFEPEKRGINCIYCNYGKILQLISKCNVESNKENN